MKFIGHTFVFVGIACLAVAITAGFVAGLCFDAADEDGNSITE